MSVQKFIVESLEEEGRVVTVPGQKAPATLFDQELHSRVCSGCSCLCDDISFFMRGGQVVRTMNLCEIGWRRLRPTALGNQARVASPERLGADVKRAAEILRAHTPPLILGAENLDEASIRICLRLAEALGGGLLPRAFDGIRRFYSRAKRFGWTTAILDEVRDQADLVIFWRADPLETHHRHLSRYSLFARGRFTERGNHDRNLAAVASGKKVIEPLCQQYFDIPAGEDRRFIEALSQPSSEHGFDHRDFPMLVKALERAFFHAVFVDPEEIVDEALDALFLWSARVNSEGRRRMVVLPLWKKGSNLEGFCQICLEQRGTAWGADFRAESSGMADGSMDWRSLGRKIGSVLVLPSEGRQMGNLELPEPLTGKPRIVLDPFRQVPADGGHLVIPVAVPGIETDGVFFRADGLPLKVAAIEGLAPCPYPAPAEVLGRLLEEVG